MTRLDRLTFPVRAFWLRLRRCGFAELARARAAESGSAFGDLNRYMESERGKDSLDEAPLVACDLSHGVGAYRWRGHRELCARGSRGPSPDRGALVLSTMSV